MHFKNAIGILAAVCESALLTHCGFACLQSCRRFSSAGDCTPTETKLYFTCCL